MNHDDPRLKHGIHVRAKLYRPDDAECTIVEGYVIDPKRMFVECMNHPARWPTGWNWCGIAWANNARWTADEFERMTTGGDAPMSKLSQLSREPLPTHWLHEATVYDLEYLDAGFSGPVKPKNRRGKRHRMRTGGLLGETL